MSKHTPGAWAVVNLNEIAARLNTAKSRYVARATDEGGKDADVWSKDLDVIVANARLISAAPDLYEALRNLLDVVNVRLDDPRTEVFDQARAALEKAGSES